MIYSIFYFIFQFGGLAPFLGWHKPTKTFPRRHDQPQPTAILWGKNDCKLHLTTKHHFENFGRANCPFVPLQDVGLPTIKNIACKLQKLVPMQKSYCAPSCKNVLGTVRT